MNDKLRIFCDMDGCISDWSSSFKKICPEDLDARGYEAKYGKNSFWHLIDQYGSKWWADLPWTTNGRKLWDFIYYNFNFDDIYILSAPSKNFCIEGKLVWLERELGLKGPPCTNGALWKGEKIIFEKKKHLVCTGHRDILIDDTLPKINAWTDAGGTGILHDDMTYLETIKKLSEIKDIFSRIEVKDYFPGDRF